jgi:probable sporulation protein (polysaccharide deacetylase family)
LTSDERLTQVELLAHKLKRNPVDARIEKVWKAIPDYNGIELDPVATYEKWKREGGALSEDKWVLKQVPAKITLDQLPPAPIYRGNPQKPMVAFMVNVAWGTEYLPFLFTIAEQEKIKFTFFLDGSWTNKNGELARQIVAKGHEIGNHAYTHPSMSRLNDARVREEIEKTNKVIFEKTGVRPLLFAPPSGDYDERTVKIAAEQGMKTILWTLDTIDWQKPAPATIIARIVPKLDNGVLVLMHPTEPTVQALPELIKAARQKGLKIGTVSELISPEHIIKFEENR